MAARRFRIVLCRGPECGDRRGSAALHEVFRAALEAHGVSEQAELAWQSCFGRCTQGPNVLVREIVGAPAAGPGGLPAAGSVTGGLAGGLTGGLMTGGLATLPGPRGSTALYNRMDAARVELVVERHIKGGQVARELIERPGVHGIGVAPPLASRTKDS